MNQKRRITVNAKSFEVEIISRAPGEVRFRLEGREYKAAWEKSLAETNYKTSSSKEIKSKKSSSSNKSRAASAEGKIVAPIPGVVTKLEVAEGDEVSQGNLLLSYEAMKMENQILAPYDGIVKELLVNEGDEIKDQEILLHLEKTKK